MHFTYSADSRDHLSQGDVLQRSAELDAILAVVHPHYIDKKNTNFLVLTQTCDLVRRHGDPCKARYVSLAAVRPLSAAYERELQKLALGPYEGLPPIIDTKARSTLDLFLERLFNNNDPNYFFLASEPTLAFPLHSCAFLRLSVAVRAEEHYETLLSCRLLQLEEPFQAKLGWLVGQLYSRVGTKDWDEKELRKQINETHNKEAVWVDFRVKKKLVKEIEKEIDAAGGESLEDVDVENLIKRIPARKDEVLQRIDEIVGDSLLVERLKKGGQLSDKDLEKLLNALRADQRLTTLLRF